MTNLVDELRALGRSAEISMQEVDLRPGSAKRIRLRQVATLALATLLIAGLAGGSLTAYQWATQDVSLARRPMSSPLPTGPISVTVASQTYTLTVLEDGTGTEIRVEQSPEPNVGSLGTLPLPEKVTAIEFGDPSPNRKWGILGVVPSEAERVLIVFEGGPTVEATIYALPPSVASLRAFGAEATGVSFQHSHEIRVLDAAGKVIAIEERRGALTAQPTMDPGPRG